MFFLNSNNNRSQLQSYESWKDINSNNKIIVAKNIKNQASSNSINNDPEKMMWNKNCEIKKKYKFNPNPIKHYRKQYSSTNSFSNNSLIGFLDKPGNNIVTKSPTCIIDLSGNSMQNIELHLLNNNSNINNINNIKNCEICPASMIIKSSSTVLDNRYCSSNKEYLYKKCKTFKQNLPLKEGTVSESNCKNDPFECKQTFNPSNSKYKTQGPITGSARTSALKYGCKDGKQCHIKKTSYNDFNLCGDSKDCITERNKQILLNPACIGCKQPDSKIRRKRINILH